MKKYFSIALVLTAFALASCGDGGNGTNGDGTDTLDSTAQTAVSWKIPKQMLTDKELHRLFPKEWDGYESTPITGAKNRVQTDSFYTARTTLTNGDVSIEAQLFDYFHAPMSRVNAMNIEGWEFQGFVVDENIDDGKMKGFRAKDTEGNAAICILVLGERFSIISWASGTTDSQEAYRVAKMFDTASMKEAPTSDN